MKLKIILINCIFFTGSSFVQAQKFYNLNFDQICDTSKTGLCFWDLSWGNKENVKRDIVDNSKCLLIQSGNKNSVGFAEQSSSFPLSKDMHILTVSAIIRSLNIEGKGAGLNVGLYDKDGNLLTFKDMGGVYSLDWIRGTTKSKKYSIALICPVETVKIKIGAILYGKGKAWFKDYKVSVKTVTNSKPSKLAVKYISAICDTIKKHSLVRDSIAIEPLKTIALNIAGAAKAYTDCYLAVNYLIESLRQYGDYHSFFMNAKEVNNWLTSGSQVNKIQSPSYKIIDSCGYISVPSFHGGNQKLILAYADSLQAAIRKLESSGIKGWIIDLRENTGGNQEPMIAGLGPLFSSDKLGSLVDVNNNYDAWHYKNGHYFEDTYPGWKVSNPVTLKAPLPIAVLTSSVVGSSGEIVVISFISNAKTKSFGQQTLGLTTGNGSFDLADGSKIFIASTIMADRNNKKYYGSIKPDVQIDNNVINGTDRVIKSAAEWIELQH
jgi:hypothetical protein